MAELMINWPILITFLLLFISFLKLRQNKSRETRGAVAPEPPGAWPIIGHFHHLVGSTHVCRTLGAIADSLGPAFMIRFGIYPTFVVSGWELAKECFVMNDKKLANRPRSTAGNILSYDYAMIGFAPYGPYWREVRKIATIELLSNRRMQQLNHIREGEISLFIKELYEMCKESPAKLDMQMLFGRLTMNVIVKLVAGKRCVNSYGENDIDGGQLLETISKFFDLAIVPVISDMIPFPSWLDFRERSMKRTARDMDVIIQQWLDEHRHRKRRSQPEIGDPQDFMDIIVSIIDAHEDQTFYGFDKDKAIKGTATSLIINATDTTAVTLTWALALLLKNPTILKKAQEELDIHVGRDRKVTESDIDKLEYLQAIVKETLRLYPAGPLSAPHEAIEDCEIGGYQVKAGTQVLLNVWKLQRDPRVWPDPLEFKPERFLTGVHKDVDVRGQHFELIPFGLGRRSCPGTSLALLSAHYVLACLLQAFELKIPAECSGYVDLTEGVGLTLPKATPLHVLLSPSLPNFPSIYVGHFIIFMGWSIHVATLLIGLGYGAHWAIVPATASELFGLKKFGALYNFLTLANPAGSLVFSGIIASSIYDHEAEKQAHDIHGRNQATGLLFFGMVGLEEPLKCVGVVCFSITSIIMAVFCIIACALSLILVYQTKVVYAHLYGKPST